MNRVAYGPYENAKLLSPLEILLLDAEYHRAKILVVGEVIPMLGAIEVLLVRLLLHRRQLEALILLPLLLNGRFLARHLVHVLVLLHEAVLRSLLLRLDHQLLVRLLEIQRLLGIGALAIALALVVDRVRLDLLTRALDPVARRGYEVVRKLFAEFICKNIIFIFFFRLS